MAVAVLTLPHQYQLSAEVLSNPIAMCVEVGDVCRQLQVIDGQKPLRVLVGEDVSSFGGAEC